MRPRLMLPIAVAASAALCLAPSAAPAPSVVRLAVSVTPTKVTGGAAVAGTVTLDSAAPAGGLAVTLHSSSAAVAVPPHLRIAAGRTSASFTIATKPVAETDRVTITASAGAPARARLTVKEPHLISIAIPPVLHSGEEFTGTVTLNGAAPAGGCAVILRTQAPGSYLSHPPSTTVAAGETSADFRGHVGSVPSQRSGQIVAEAGGSVLPASTRLMP